LQVTRFHSIMYC